MFSFTLCRCNPLYLPCRCCSHRSCLCLQRRCDGQRRVQRRTTLETLRQVVQSGSRAFYPSPSDEDEFHAGSLVQNDHVQAWVLNIGKSR
ncbi:hypothetical protein ABBQ38_002750 [Trebouxia sp. C0009 RCD-2024]